MSAEVAPLFSADYFQNPFPTLADLREKDPVHQFTFPVGDVPMWLITRYDDARSLLGDTRLSPEGRTWGNEAFVSAGLVSGEGSLLEHAVTVVDPPSHTRLRKLGMRPFTPARALQWSRLVQQTTQETLARCHSQETFDVMANLAGPVSSTVMGRILGLRIDRHEYLVEALAKAFPSSPEDARDATSGFMAICDYAAELVDEKRAHPADDLTTDLLAASEDGDRLSPEEVLAMVASMILAGSDTVRAFLGNSVYTLLQHRDQWLTITNSEEGATSAIEELLRYEGALSSALFRLATEDLEIRGVTIRQGDPVVVSLAAANRDPLQFENPDTLDLRRTGPKHLGLGHGIHNCMGSGLARMEGRIVLSELLTTFPDLEIDPDADLKYIENWAMRRLVSLPVKTKAGS